jgi:shikimate dehydrogenase
MNIGGHTRIAAVLGHPVKHTASPPMHNAAFRELGLDWCYVALDVPPSDLGTVVRGLAAAGLVGVNLTVPHKMLALRFIDALDPTAGILGSANTLRFSRRNGKPFIEGFSTDGYGLLKALKEDLRFDPRGKTIAIVGCGGVGRATAIQLALAGARRLALINRTASKARAIAQRIRQLRTRHKTECGFAPVPCDLLVQATSLGLKEGDPLPTSEKILQSLRPPLMLEMIYRPAETPIMRHLKKRACRCANGLGMLLHQGVRSLEIWTGRKAPVEAMRRALKREVYG